MGFGGGIRVLPPPPLHTLAVVWVCFKREGRVDPLALIVSSSVVDLEPFFVLVFGLRQPVHGYWHSYFGVLLIAVPLTLGICFVESRAARVVEAGWRMLKIDRVRVRYPFEVVLYSNVIGGFSHVFFDMFTHRSFPYVFYPLVKFSNPVWMGIEAALVVEAFVVLLSAYSCWLWLKSFLREGQTRKYRLQLRALLYEGV